MYVQMNISMYLIYKATKLKIVELKKFKNVFKRFRLFAIIRLKNDRPNALGPM